MIALFDFFPSHCPNCGKNIRLTGYASQDYGAKASFQCGCGLNYQLADTDALLDAADQTGGDLKRQESMR